MMLARLLPLTALAMSLLFGGCRSAGPSGAGSAVEPAEVFENTIKWSTASEVDNFGFDVYRSESKEGPFVRINEQVIEGAGTTDEPRYYEFVDATIDPRKTYFYYVESISMSGTREQFTPIGKASPKVPGSSEPAPGSASADRPGSALPTHHFVDPDRGER